MTPSIFLTSYLIESNLRQGKRFSRRRRQAELLGGGEAVEPHRTGDALFAQVVILEVEQAKSVVEVVDKGVDAGGPRHVAHGDAVGGQPRLGRTRRGSETNVHGTLSPSSTTGIDEPARTAGWRRRRGSPRDQCESPPRVLWPLRKAKANRKMEGGKKNVSMKMQRNLEQNCESCILPPRSP